METKRRDEEIYEELCKDQDLIDRYQRPGLYSIHIEDKLVYIGKSRNILKRLASHMAETEYSKSHKYQILRQARNRGLKIQFNPIYYSYATGEQEIDDDIGFKEAEAIWRQLPPLNYQLPLLDNYHRFEVNKRAHTIQLAEILNEPLFYF